MEKCSPFKIDMTAPPSNVMRTMTINNNSSFELPKGHKVEVLASTSSNMGTSQKGR